MPRNNRSYKKGKPHRDARLFVIVAEGEREDAYFRFFNEKNQRVQIKIAGREENKSAPNFFLERVEKMVANGIWSPKNDDILWFVLDVDKWNREEIENLKTACEVEENWNIAISNPCFEVWLIFHIQNEITDKTLTCKQLKSMLHEVTGGGFEINRFAYNLPIAVKNARAADTNPNGHFPDKMQTKLYLLGEQLLQLLGNNWTNKNN